MRVVKQPLTLTIKKFDNFTNNNEKSRHNCLFPNTIRCIIAGPSNSGKTNVMLNLLENINGLRFENVYVYSKSLYQPIYTHIRNILNSIHGIKYNEFHDAVKIMHPSKAKPNSIFIFDDVACEKQSVMRDFFSMGRHNLIDSFYLTQTYAHVPKHLVRDNSNMLILFKQDDMNLKHIYRDHVNTDMTFDQFHKICSQCWMDKYCFLVICKDFDLHNGGRYRKGFDQFIEI